MKKAITQFFGFEYDWKQRTKDIKDAGFDACMTSIDEQFEKQNGALVEQVKKFKEVGLEPDTLHCSYNTPELHWFWEEGEKGDEILNKLKEELLLAKQYSFKAFVVHILGTPSKIGLDRMRELIEYAEEIKEVVALENVQNPDTLDFVFENLNSDYLKFCYDSGHENFSSIQKGVLEKYLDKLVCFHLHDNNGESDQHTLNKYGSINWDKLAKILAQKEDIENITLSYELLMRYREDETPKQVLDESYHQACDFEKLINKYKKQAKI